MVGMIIIYIRKEIFNIYKKQKVMKEFRPKIWLSGHPEFMMMYWKEYLYDLRQFIKGIGYKETLIDYQHEVHLFYEPI